MEKQKKNSGWGRKLLICRGISALIIFITVSVIAILGEAEIGRALLSGLGVGIAIGIIPAIIATIIWHNW